MAMWNRERETASWNRGCTAQLAVVPFLMTISELGAALGCPSAPSTTPQQLALCVFRALSRCLNPRPLQFLNS